MPVKLSPMWLRMAVKTLERCSSSVNYIRSAKPSVTRTLLDKYRTLYRICFASLRGGEVDAEVF